MKSSNGLFYERVVALEQQRARAAKTADKAPKRDVIGRRLIRRYKSVMMQPLAFAVVGRRHNDLGFGR